jgi:hypothetical protein
MCVLRRSVELATQPGRLADSNIIRLKTKNPRRTLPAHMGPDTFSSAGPKGTVTRSTSGSFHKTLTIREASMPPTLCVFSQSIAIFLDSAF